MDILILPDRGAAWVLALDEKGRVVRKSINDPSVNIGRTTNVKSTHWGKEND